MTSLRTFILAPIYGFAAVCFGLMAYAVGPDLEESLWPVITDQSVVDRWRTTDSACFQWRYTKARSVTLVSTSYVIEREDGIRFPVDEFRPDLGIPSNETTTAKAGTTRTIPKCVTVPVALRDAISFTIRGRQSYKPWHRLWTLDQPVIPVKIDMPVRSDTSAAP